MNETDENRNTQFERASDQVLRRCKMYLLINTHNHRARAVVEFEKEIYDAARLSKIACVLSDSGKQQWSVKYQTDYLAPVNAEVFKLKSVFSHDYRPIIGRPSLCAFGIMHPNLAFHFDDPSRGPRGKY